jgi:hypothetical protein
MTGIKIATRQQVATPYTGKPLLLTIPSRQVNENMHLPTNNQGNTPAGAGTYV